VSIADLVHATETWIDQIEWARLRRQYPRLMGALSVLQDLVPWSPHVADVVREQVTPPATAVRAYPMASDMYWSARLLPAVLWPPDWWFRMRYGHHVVASLDLVSRSGPSSASPRSRPDGP
jgi:hypothetical protein